MSGEGGKYEKVDIDRLRPGQLCTVLRGRRRTLKRKGVAIVESSFSRIEHYEFWKGWPLRLVYADRQSPYVLFDVLKGGDPTHGELPGRIMVDKRLVKMVPVTDEYRRHFLGHGYRTTL